MIFRFLPKLLAVLFAGLVSIAPAMAQDQLDDGPKSLVISYRSTAAHRPAFRQYLATNLAPRLRAMKAKGEIADFRIFFSWYHQPAVWDGLVILRFPTFAAVGGWNKLERTQPGGLDASGLALADPVASYSSDLAWSRNPDTLKDGEVYYIIPYEYRNEAEYRDYVKAYVQPQFDGWIQAAPGTPCSSSIIATWPRSASGSGSPPACVRSCATIRNGRPGATRRPTFAARARTASPN
jgi:hypothetical protein